MRGNTPTRVLVFSLLLLLAGALLHAGPPEAPQPAPAPAASAAPPEAALPVLDNKALSELALEHSRARDDLLAAEARLALLAEKVFDSRLVVHYEGSLDSSFKLALLELDIDGQVAYRQEFSDAARIEVLKLFDGFLPPGRHVLQLRLYSRSPDETTGIQPGYFAGSGLAVHLREKAVTEATFKADQDGDPPGQKDLKHNDPDGSWTIKIKAKFETSPK